MNTPAQNPSGTTEASVVTMSAPVAPAALSTMNDDGSRKWLFPKVSPGKHLNRRRAVAWLLIALFTALPHLTINYKPAVLLDVAARRFTILGYTFLPTDTILLALLGIGIFLTLFLITAVVGRVWCGWACPQTVYLEFLYRPLERFFDGMPGKPPKNWFQRSGSGRFFKYVTYLFISMFLAHTFLAYFVGAATLREWVQLSPLKHPGPFLVMAGVTAAMLFDFAFFREQVCLVACPYGRFQSVMLDRNSLIVGYDRLRGEPRGMRGKGSDDLHLAVLAGVNSQSAQGDCIDCKMCVTTCPTGIDIRNGLQLECVNCAQCIDACDSVMQKIGKPLGLIRYASESSLQGEPWKFLRPRVMIYPVLLVVVISLFTYLLLQRGPAYIHVQRGAGAPFYTMPTGEVANPVRLKIINRRDVPMEYTVSTTDSHTHLIADQMPIRVEPYESVMVPATLISSPDGFTRGKHEAHISVTDSKGYHKDVSYLMLGPAGSHTKHDNDHHGESKDDDSKSDSHEAGSEGETK